MGVALFPNLVSASNNPDYSLTIYTAASSEKTLGIMLVIALIGMPMVLSYTVIVYWTFRGKVTEPDVLDKSFCRRPFWGSGLEKRPPFSEGFHVPFCLPRYLFGTACARWGDADAYASVHLLCAMPYSHLRDRSLNGQGLFRISALPTTPTGSGELARSSSW